MRVLDSKFLLSLRATPRYLMTAKHFLSGGSVEISKEMTKVCAMGLELFCYTLGKSAFANYLSGEDPKHLKNNHLLRKPT